MLGLFLASYPVSMMFSRTGHFLLSGFVLIVAAIGLYVHFYLKEKKILDFRGLISLAWIGGEGLAALKLTNLGAEWHILTWTAFLLFYLCFLWGYEKLSKRKPVENPSSYTDISLKRLRNSAVILAALSLLSFCTEAAALGFVPLFSNEPHAYSYFHLTGIHYFTVSSILIAPLSVIYFYCEKERTTKKILLWAALDVLAFAIPVLCVSRFMLIMGAGMAVLTYLLLDEKIRLRYLVLTGIGLVAAYLFLSVARNHDAAYLSGIFEMKNPDMPIYLSQPYIYVAMNYENFNYLVVNLIEHAFGMRELYPFIALTGAKFVIPGLGTEYPLYLRKEELSTLTLIYDAYYDFHLAGVAGLGLLFGYVCKKVSDGQKHGKNPVSALFYVQLAMYALLSFFTSWFSVATTWFWLALTAVLYVATGWKRQAIPKGAWKKTLAGVGGAFLILSLCAGLVRMHGFPKKVSQEDFSFGLQFYTDRRTGDGARVQTNWWKDEENGKYYLFLPSGVNLELAEVQLTGADRVVLDGKTVWHDSAVFTWAGMHDISVPSTGKLYQVEFVQSQGVGAVFLDSKKRAITILNKEGIPEYTGKVSFNTDTQYEKPYYQMSFEKEISFYGIGISKDWILLGNANDSTMLRNYVAFDIAYQMGAYDLPQSAFADLYQDGEYLGTYQVLTPVTEEMLCPNNLDGLVIQYLMENVFYGITTWYQTEEINSITKAVGVEQYGSWTFYTRVKELYTERLADIVNNEIKGRTDQLAQQLTGTVMMDGYRWRKWSDAGSREARAWAFLRDVSQLNFELFERFTAVGTILNIQ